MLFGVHAQVSYMYIYICACIYAGIYVYILTCEYIHMCICTQCTKNMYIHLSLCTHGSHNIYLCAYIHIYMYIYMYMVNIYRRWGFIQSVASRPPTNGNSCSLVRVCAAQFLDQESRRTNEAGGFSPSPFAPQRLLFSLAR